jgi:hypothetical protein
VVVVPPVPVLSDDDPLAQDIEIDPAKRRQQASRLSVWLCMKVSWVARLP